jgi:Kinesin motor domain
VLEQRMAGALLRSKLNFVDLAGSDRLAVFVVSLSKSELTIKMPVMQLVVEQRMAGGVLRSKLNFVDLAGSERWSAHVEMSDVRVSELTSINQSLSTLITVVASLTEEGRQHIPYRQVERSLYILQCYSTVNWLSIQKS